MGLFEKLELDPGEVFNAKGRTIYAIALSPDGKWFAASTGTYDRNCVFVWPFTNPVDLRNMQKLELIYRCLTLSFTPDSRELLASNAGSPTSWRLDDQGLFQLTKSHGYMGDRMKTGHNIDRPYIYDSRSSSNCDLLIVLKAKDKWTRRWEARVWKRTLARSINDPFQEVQRRDLGRITHKFGPPRLSCSSNGKTYIQIPPDNSLSPVTLWQFGDDGRFHEAFTTPLPLENIKRRMLSSGKISPNARWLVYWTRDHEKPHYENTNVLEITQDGIRGRGISLGNQQTIDS